jgi:hypothetical protein
MAGLHHSANRLAHRKVGDDFRRFARQQLPSFVSDDLTQQLYDEFRNGLSHEARIKNRGGFSFDRPRTVRDLGERLCINPAYLLEIGNGRDRDAGLPVPP